jgi:hypothetical protein
MPLQGIDPAKPMVPHDLSRQGFIKTGAGLGVAARTASPDVTLSALAGPTTYYRHLDQVVPAHQLGPVVDAHLDLVSTITHTVLPNSAGFAALSEVCGLAAWLAIDRNDHTMARQRYGQAVGYAERAHHQLLGAYMTASLGHFAIGAGDVSRGLAMIRSVDQQLDHRAPDSARAWLYSLQAVGHAAVGDADEATFALRAADRHVDRAGGEPHWPWVFAFDAAKAARYRGDALRRLGQHRAAQRAYTCASQGQVTAKTHALIQTEHAHSLAVSGEFEEACRLAVDAATVAHHYGSERIIAGIRSLRAALPGREPAARPLDDVLGRLYQGDVG